MTRARKLKSRGNVFTPFTGCARIYHQRWYVRSPRGKFHLHGSPLRFGRRRADVHRTSCALRRALSALRQPKGETTILLRRLRLLPLPFSELCVQTKAKVRLLSAHKVYVRAPLPCRQNVGVAYG
ncbi:MAG: hypothetical protein HFG28_14835 [Eubacterium sp.]|nr:hypothetical protein [Eubacterium sp.]